MSNVSADMLFNPIIYTFENPRPQNFTIPTFMVKYIEKNWSGKVYEKLNYCCKYFFSKEQPIIVKDYLFGAWIYQHEHYQWQKNVEENKLWLGGDNYAALKDAKKFWFTGILISQNPSLPVSFIIKFMWLCDITVLNIWNQQLNLGEFLILAKKLKILRIFRSNFLKANGSRLTAGDILALCPKLEQFFYEDNMNYPFTLRTSEGMLPHLPNLRCLDLSKLYYHFDYNCIEFMRNHPNITFRLSHWEYQCHGNFILVIVNTSMSSVVVGFFKL